MNKEKPMFRDRETLFKKDYSTLPPAQREALLLSLPEADKRFQFLRFERFARFGMQTDTAVYLCDGRKFVFVPGDTVTLGWTDFAAGMDEKTRCDMQKSLNEYGVDLFLRESMSPVRIAALLTRLFLCAMIVYVPCTDSGSAANAG